MALHLVKLCVGVDSVEDLQERIERRLAAMRAAGEAPEQRHTTRMAPRRAGELLAGGSLYWVIRGAIQVRQRLLAVRRFIDEAGIQRCHLVLEPVFVATERQPRRAFQGWRYLEAADAPTDLAPEGGIMALPPQLRRDLAELGLL